MLYFKLYPFTLLRQCRSFTFLFMYLGELLQYYQSSNNLPQSVKMLDFDLKSCFVLLNTSTTTTLLYSLLTCLRLTLWCFGLLRTSSRSPCRRLVSLSILVGLVSLGPRVALLVLVLSPSQSFILCVALLFC